MLIHPQTISEIRDVILMNRPWRQKLLIKRKIIARTLIDVALYISGSSEYECLMNPSILFEDDYDINLLDGVILFEPPSSFEKELQREYNGWSGFWFVDGKILKIIGQGETKEHTPEEMLEEIYG